MKTSIVSHVSRGARRSTILLSVAGLGLGLAACSSSNTSGGTPSAGSTNGGGIAVALITKDSTNPFFVAMQKGAQAAADAANVKLTIASGSADGDEAGQNTAIENAMAAGVKGILITPNGPGVDSDIKAARAAGIYVIALDTPPAASDVVDITFATDNYKAGQLIGQWTKGQLAGKPAVIALLDLFNDKVVSVDYNRDQGFLNGMGIDTKDKTKNGDEDKTGSYDGGTYTIACNEPTQGAATGGTTAMENCLTSNPNINVVYTINEPAAEGAYNIIHPKNPNALIVSVDGGCQGVQDVKQGKIGATSQQYPLKMAQLGVQAIVQIANGGAKPTTSDGLSFFNTGTALVTDKAVSGLDSITTDAASKICWGTAS